MKTFHNALEIICLLVHAEFYPADPSVLYQFLRALFARIGHTKSKAYRKLGDSISGITYTVFLIWNKEYPYFYLIL